MNSINTIQNRSREYLDTKDSHMLNGKSAVMEAPLKHIAICTTSPLTSGAMIFSCLLFIEIIDSSCPCYHLELFSVKTSCGNILNLHIAQHDAMFEPQSHATLSYDARTHCIIRKSAASRKTQSTQRPGCEMMQSRGIADHFTYKTSDRQRFALEAQALIYHSLATKFYRILRS